MVPALIISRSWSNSGRPVRSTNSVVVPNTATVYAAPWRSMQEAVEMGERIWSNAADYLAVVRDFGIEGITDERTAPDDERCEKCGHPADLHSLITGECPCEEE